MDALPEHQPWDHEISLKEGFTPPNLPLRQMSASDAQILRKYIDDNLAREFIRESTSPAGAAVLFVPKKDGDNRACIDFRDHQGSTPITPNFRNHDPSREGQSNDPT